MLENLKKLVCVANLELVTHGLVSFTWGNVSGIDREKKLVVIKPSGVAYEKMNPDDMVVVKLETGEIVEGKYKPSSDTPTHLVLYQNFPEIAGVCHTHSPLATAFAQVGSSIRAYGTTHADYFYGEIPCTEALTKESVQNNYELDTGKIIIDTFKNINPSEVPAVLVKHHGPFTWGNSPSESVFHAAVLENIAKIAYHTETLSGRKNSIPHYLKEKHFNRKHGKNAYYGQ